MRARLVVVLALVCGGCGDGDDSDGSLLEGLWELNHPDLACTLFATFEGDEYRTGQACELESGKIGIAIETGVFSVDGDRFTTTPMSGSCPDTGSDTVTFSVSGDALTLNFGSGLARFERADSDPSSGGSAIAVFGCFDNHGNFTPHEIEEY